MGINYLRSVAKLCSPSETTKLILQTLLTTASRSEGALEVVKIEDSSPFIKIATTYPIVLQILSFSWINAAAVPNTVEVVQKCINQLMPPLLVAFQDTDAVTLVDCIGDTLPKLVPEVMIASPILSLLTGITNACLGHPFESRLAGWTCPSLAETYFQQTYFS